MNTLEQRRHIFQIVLLFSIITSFISSPIQNLQNLNIKIPQRITRHYSLLNDELEKYDSPFSLHMKKQCNVIFEKKRRRNVMNLFDI